MDKRIGQTRLIPARMARLWGAGIGAALIPWIYKLAVDRSSPLLSAHEGAIHSKLTALLLLAVFGVTYVALTAAFRIPEASNVIDRARRLMKLARR
jgi:hypothetical protein